MNTAKSAQLQEANDRLKKLVRKFDLNPNLVKYWNEGKLYYSYLTGGGLLASIDTITYDPNYQKLVEEYETKTGNLVYHAVESGHLLNLLYVSRPESNCSEEQQREIWDMECLENGYIGAYVINLEEPEFSEHGDIFVEAYQHVLVRTR